jgi:hypothetical protein
MYRILKVEKFKNSSTGNTYNMYTLENINTKAYNFVSENCLHFYDIIEEEI